MRDIFSRLRHVALQEPRKWSALVRLAGRTKLRSARALRRSGDASAPPPLVTAHLINTCNLRCVQCWEWGDKGSYKEREPRRLRQELTTGEWQQIFAGLAGWKPYLYFFGGEPLLRSDLPELVRSASRLGLLTAVNSNTTLMSGELARDLVDGGLDYYIASLDGPEEINDTIRRGRDVFRRATAGIGHLLAARRHLGRPFPLVEVCMTLTPDNQDHIDETARIAEDLGVDRFSVQLGSFTTEAALAATAPRLRRLFGVGPELLRGYLLDGSRGGSAVDGRRVEEGLRALSDRRWSFELRRYPKAGVSGFDFRDYYRSPERVFGDGVCHVPWKRAVILANGDLVACPGFPEVVLGNLTRTPFAELWNAATMRRFRRTLREDGLFPACSRCCDLYELDES